MTTAKKNKQRFEKRGSTGQLIICKFFAFIKKTAHGIDNEKGGRKGLVCRANKRKNKNFLLKATSCLTVKTKGIQVQETPRIGRWVIIGVNHEFDPNGKLDQFIVNDTVTALSEGFL